MTSALPLFDKKPSPGLMLGMALRDHGITKVSAGTKGEWVAKARNIAIEHARINGFVSAFDLRDYIDTKELAPAPHKNCWGAIFRSKKFEFTGRRVQSERAERHAGEIKIWKLREAAKQQ